MNVSSKKHVIVSLEGIILDVRNRSHFAKSRNWDDYYKAIINDTVKGTNLDLVQLLASTGKIIHLVTSVPPHLNMEGELLEFFQAHNIPCTQLHLKPNYVSSFNHILQVIEIPEIGKDDVFMVLVNSDKEVNGCIKADLPCLQAARYTQQ